MDCIHIRSIWIAYTPSSENRRGICRGWNTNYIVLVPIILYVFRLGPTSNFHKNRSLFKIRKIGSDSDIALIYIYIRLFHVITIKLLFIPLFMKFIMRHSLRTLRTISFQTYICIPYIYTRF